MTHLIAPMTCYLNRTLLERLTVFWQEHLTAMLWDNERPDSTEAKERHFDDLSDGMMEMARECILEADLEEEPETTEGRIAVNRDDLRLICYELIHVVRCRRDGLKETCDGDWVKDREYAVSAGLWGFLGIEETEDQQDLVERVYSEIDAELEEQEAGEKLAVFLGLPEAPVDWVGPVPQE